MLASGGGAGGADVSRAHLAVGAAGVYVSAEYRFGDEQSGVAGDRAGAGADGADPGYGVAERGEQQPGARGRSGAGRPDGGGVQAESIPARGRSSF